MMIVQKMSDILASLVFCIIMADFWTCPVFDIYLVTMLLLLLLLMMMMLVQRRSDEHVGGCDIDTRRADITRTSRRQLDRRHHNEPSVDRHAGHPGRGETGPCRRHHPAHGRGRGDGQIAWDGGYCQLSSHSKLVQRNELRQFAYRQSITRSSALWQFV